MTRRPRKPLGKRLISSMREGVDAIEKGKPLPETVITVPPDPPRFDRHELIRLRESLGMTQVGFAEYLNVSDKTVESWEQGVRNPNGAALRLLQVMTNPSLLAPLAVVARKTDKPSNPRKRISRAKAST